MIAFRRLVSRDELEAIAHAAAMTGTSVAIEFPPGGKAGLATLDLDGRGFAARVPAAREDDQC